MVDLTENEITKEIKKLIQKDDERFDNCVLVCQKNHYIIEQIDLEPEISIKYEKFLDEISNAGIFNKDINSGYKDGSKTWYKRDIQLMNSKNVHLDIIFCKGHNMKSYVTLNVYYEDENIDLYRDKRFAGQLANEVLLPELNNILSLMNLKNKNFQEREK